MTAIVPNTNQPLVDSRGIITQTWLRFLGSLISAPEAISSVAITASPTSFTASGRGTVAISGGTLTSVTVNRSGTTVSLGTSRAIPVSNGDIVTVTYTAAPTLNFIPL